MKRFRGTDRTDTRTDRCRSLLIADLRQPSWNRHNSSDHKFLHLCSPSIALEVQLKKKMEFRMLCQTLRIIPNNLLSPDVANRTTALELLSP